MEIRSRFKYFDKLYNPGGRFPDFRGISYNPSNGFVYVAANFQNEIRVFDLDLTLIRRVSTEPHEPDSITESSNQLYVGTIEGNILVYQNEIIITQFDGCDGKSDVLTSIFFDPNDLMATSCNNLNKLYLYFQNGSFTNKSLTTPNWPYYIGFDSKDRFIQISAKQISIYN